MNRSEKADIPMCLIVVAVLFAVLNSFGASLPVASWSFDEGQTNVWLMANSTAPLNFVIEPE
jgi:hypothetical protein